MRRFVCLVLAITTSIAAAQSAPDESDPIEAAVIVYSTSYAIERWESYCAAETPSSASDIENARTNWMDAHMDLLIKAGSILKSQLSKDERVQIGVQARLANDELEGKLRAAPPESRQDWCEQSPQRILSPQMNLYRRPTLVQTIDGFDS